MERFLVVFVLAALVLLGCTGNKTGRTGYASQEQPLLYDSLDSGEEEDTVMPLGADELFDDFVFIFASNRTLQMERIAFPLAIVDVDGKQTTIGKRQWKMEPFFMNQDYYTLVFDNPEQMELVKDTALTEVTVEKIMLADSLVHQYSFCRQEGRWMLTQVRHQALSHNANAQFFSFYQQFVADSVFQYASLSEQIEFSGPDPDDDFAQVEGVITPDFWSAFAPELPTDMLYNIVYGLQDPASTQKIFVLRGIANGLETELTFVQKNGRWKLTRLST